MKNTTYKIIGITDDTHICEHCGKQNLKRVVVLEHIDTGAIVRMGTTCAFKALGVKQDAIDAEIKLRAEIAAWIAKGYALLLIVKTLNGRSRKMNARVVAGKILVDGIVGPLN